MKLAGHKVYNVASMEDVKEFYCSSLRKGLSIDKPSLQLRFILNHISRLLHRNVHDVLLQQSLAQLQSSDNYQI